MHNEIQSCVLADRECNKSEDVCNGDGGNRCFHVDCMSSDNLGARKNTSDSSENTDSGINSGSSSNNLNSLRYESGDNASNPNLGIRSEIRCEESSSGTNVFAPDANDEDITIVNEPGDNSVNYESPVLKNVWSTINDPRVVCMQAVSHSTANGKNQALSTPPSALEVTETPKYVSLAE